MSDHSNTSIGNEIAIVGMACRMPGANNIDEFWDLIQNGREHISFLSENQLRNNGVAPEKWSQPGYIPARGTMEDVEMFDADFFGISPMEAKYMDPQQRWFLETAWTALEHAGYSSGSFNGRIGVFAGAAWNSYLLNNLASHPGLFDSEAGHLALLGNDKDHLSTRVAYKLDLNGAAITIQTACSSSLVAISLACQSLRLYENDLVIAGGVSITSPVGGYVHRTGGSLSADGHCRPFDEQASGTVTGDGVGIVVLKRLEDAVNSNDTIYGVIRACAVNNDGARKMGYTAPGITGQAEAILEALAEANITPGTIGYLEAHGTGTILGDPIEIAALTQAFRQHTPHSNYCAIGSVKANIGHLDAAAGVSGLIKTVMMLRHGKIPPSVNFSKPNSRIDFEHSPFYVNTRLKDWNKHQTPKRAAVSSFGLGGTNAHLILEEWTPQPGSKAEFTQQHQFNLQQQPSRELLVLSAKTTTALSNIAGNLHNFLLNNTNLRLEDIAYTLQAGRKSLRYRAACICNNFEDAMNFLQSLMLELSGNAAGGTQTFRDISAAGIQNNGDQRMAAQLENLAKTSRHGWYTAIDEVKNAWLGGLDFNWQNLRAQTPAQRIALPTYPFERKRYWMDPATRPHTGYSSNTNNLAGLLKTANTNLMQLPEVDEKTKELDRNKGLLEELAAAYIMDAFYKSGCFTSQGSTHTLNDILHACKAVESYRQLLADWLRLLCQQGRLLDLGADTYAATKMHQPNRTAHEVLLEVQDKWTGQQHVLNLVARCGQALPDVIQQTAKPLELFAPVINAAPATGNFPENLFAEALTKLLTANTGSAPMKLLEIGGGTGIAATKVLPLLPKQHSYHFTDLNPYFVNQAKKRFQAFSNVSFQVLDIEKTPGSQGCSTGIYDLAVAVNVLHALSDVSRALAHIRQLLKPGGMLIIWELTEATLEFAMTYGLLMSPVFNELNRSQGKPFLSVEQWRLLLEDAGFYNVNAYPENLALGQCLLMATSTQGGASLHPAQGSENISEYKPGENIDWLPGLAKKPDLRYWAYSPTWRRVVSPVKELPVSASGSGGEYWLMFMDKSGMGEQLAALARSHGHRVIGVYYGQAAARTETGDFIIHPNRKQDLETIADELIANGTLVTNIVHLSTHDYVQQATPPNVAALLEESGFLGLIYLVQVFGQRCAATLKQITVMVPEANNVMGDELPQPLHAMVGGFCAAVEQELAGVSCRCADVPLYAPGRSVLDSLLRNVYHDLVFTPAASIIAYRGTQRWARAYEPFLLESALQTKPKFKEHGVYLITGGLGKIGMSLALHLAEHYHAKLILLTRKELPDPSLWAGFINDHPTHPTASILEKLLQVKQSASALLVSTTDVCELQQMQALAAAVKKEFGPVNGIIHGAGLLGDGGIAQKTPEDFCSVLSPKIMGYYNLERAFDLDALDFIALFSSLSAVLPAFGQSAYASANCYLDALAERQTLLGKKNLYCINWDVWKGDGMAYDAKAPGLVAALKMADFDQRGILPNEGVEVFSRAIHSGRSRVMICTSEYLKRSEFEENNVTQLYMNRLDGGAQQAAVTKVEAQAKNNDEEIEEFLVNAWKELLEIEQVSPGDKFIDLGGDSLIGMQLISRIQGKFGVMLPTGIVYEDCTIPKLCSEIKTVKKTAVV